jgi:D-3-phosphoglycerate dehydrogenase
MKILAACELPSNALQQLRSLASEVAHAPRADAQELRGKLSGVGILIVGERRVSAEMLSAADALQMIVRAGPGPGDVDVEEASNQGIFVTHCPDNHATAVAELTFALMLALDRRLIENTLALREGRWTRTKLDDARGLAGRTLGILGYDAIGRLVARRARAFDMQVVAWSPVPSPHTPEEPHVEFCNWPRELARRADFVTVHYIRDHAHETVVTADFLQNMKSGTCLVHVGHPGAADEAALAQAVEQGRLRVAVDVFTASPSGDHARLRTRLCELPGVVCTQHIGPLTEQAKQATAQAVVDVVRAFLVSGEVRHCLNLADRSPATWQLVLRARDQVGVMAGILEAIRADGINAEEITSRVFTGAKAAWVTIALDERPSTEALDALRGLPDVLHLELRAVV